MLPIKSTASCKLFRSVVSVQLNSDRQISDCCANCHNYVKKSRAG